ncbi:MAG: EamA family transporter [Solirubrobacterales bacterium]|nr:EamA family transporter [Solirubrobacterales bacterium]
MAELTLRPVRRPDAIGAGSAALLATTMFFWGTAFRATAIGAGHASPTVFSALRALPATLALLLAVAVSGARLPRDRPMLILGAISGPLVVSLTFEGIAVATKLAGAGNAAVLINTAPFFAVVFASAIFAQRTSRTTLGGLVIGFAGVVVMVSSQLGATSSVGQTALGMFIALAAAAGFAVGALITGHAAARDPRLDMLGFTTLQYIVGSLLLIALAAIFGDVGGTDGARRPCSDRSPGSRSAARRPPRCASTSRCAGFQPPGPPDGNSSRRWSPSWSRPRAAMPPVWRRSSAWRWRSRGWRSSAWGESSSPRPSADRPALWPRSRRSTSCPAIPRARRRSWTGGRRGRRMPAGQSPYI